MFYISHSSFYFQPTPKMGNCAKRYLAGFSDFMTFSKYVTGPLKAKERKKTRNKNSSGGPDEFTLSKFTINPFILDL